MKAKPNSSMVIRALWHLRDRNSGGVTADEVADYLEFPIESIRPLLRELERERLWRQRQRQGRKVWLPWEAA